MLQRENLHDLYVKDMRTVKEVAKLYECSESTVYKWMKYYGIPRRDRSEASYLAHNHGDDGYNLAPLDSDEKLKLYGMGIGLFWGEGNKANKYSVRLGNTDPYLLKTFMRFLTEIYCVPKGRLKFGLQIFTDIDQNEALEYWIKELNVQHSQFYKITVTISGSLGTYRNKSKYNVVTIYYNNKKLRDLLVNSLPR